MINFRYIGLYQFDVAIRMPQKNFSQISRKTTTTLTLMAVSRVVSRLVAATISARSCRWKLRSLRARSSISAFNRISSAMTVGKLDSSVMRWATLIIIISKVLMCTGTFYTKCLVSAKFTEDVIYYLKFFALNNILCSLPRSQPIFAIMQYIYRIDADRFWKRGNPIGFHATRGSTGCNIRSSSSLLLRTHWRNGLRGRSLSVRGSNHPGAWTHCILLTERQRPSIRLLLLLMLMLRGHWLSLRRRTLLRCLISPFTLK